jgi:ADP-ribose diphosphatase
MPQKPEILDSRIVAESRIFRIERLALKFSNGARREYERLVGTAYGAVLIVPVLDEKSILLIREYAAGTDRYELGFPKGRIERGEDMMEAAQRELMEEVGYGARRLDLIDSLSLAPGYLSHVTHIILARDLYPESLEGDEPEQIEVLPWRLSELPSLLAREDFSEGRSIAALFLAREILQHSE